VGKTACKGGWGVKGREMGFIRSGSGVFGSWGEGKQGVERWGRLRYRIKGKGNGGPESYLKVPSRLLEDVPTH